MFDIFAFTLTATPDSKKKNPIYSSIHSRFSRSNTARRSSICPVMVGPLRLRLVSLFCSLKIPPLIKERTLEDEVNTVLFYEIFPF